MMLQRPGQPALATAKLAGAGPTVLFCPGFMSDMSGTKAVALEAHCAARGQAMLRFDYRGHGASEGTVAAATIGDWRADTLAVIDALSAGPLVLVGSSMGGWMALLAAIARPQRVAGLVLIAAAPDFTEWGLWGKLSPEAQAKLARDGHIAIPSAYGPAPMVLTQRLIEEGRAHALLHAPIPFSGPVRLLHGQADPDVPWQHSLKIAEQLTSPDVRLTFVKDGDHRLSRPQDLALLCATVDELSGRGWRTSQTHGMTG
jgi:pimeloyl-ACP methyl ester carboxylesterase